MTPSVRGKGVRGVCQIVKVDNRGDGGCLAYLESPDDTDYNTLSGGCGGGSTLR